ncbi:MAG: outer membrane protein assembly factor BamD [Deltaproteobacteria bacterium]|nr:outer membrane protein assembly factor BamD [Deltaproteobacteria bacterium]
MVRLKQVQCFVTLTVALTVACAPAAHQGSHTPTQPKKSRESVAALGVRCLKEHAAAKAALNAADYPRAADAAERLMGVYQSLAQQLGNAAARADACGTTAEETVGQVAQTLHVKTPSTERALKILMAWVSAFAHRARDIPAVLVLVKMLEERKLWRDAARAYARVAALEPVRKHARAAAHAAVAMWSRVRATAKDTPRGKRPLTVDERDYLKAVDKLLSLEGKTKLRAELTFRKAQLLDSVGQSQAAFPLCEAVVTQYERSSVAPYAALLLLNILSEQKAEARLVSWVQRLSKRRRLARGELGRTLRTFRLHAMRGKAQKEADAGHYRACAKLYLKLARARGEKRGDLALYNAAACQQSAGDLPHAVATRKRLAARFPKSNLAPKAMLQNGRALMTLGKAAAASRCYERFARRYPNNPGASGALVQAINARLKAGQKKQARALLKRMKPYAARYPQLMEEARKAIDGTRSADGLDATVTPGK